MGETIFYKVEKSKEKDGEPRLMSCYELRIYSLQEATTCHLLFSDKIPCSRYWKDAIISVEKVKGFPAYNE